MKAPPLGNGNQMPSRIGPRLRHYAEVRSDQVALVDERGEVTFAELWTEAGRALTHLEALGHRWRGNLPVAFTAHPKRESLILLAALWAASIPAVPLHPKWREQHRQQALASAPPHLFVADTDLERWPLVASASAHRARGGSLRQLGPVPEPASIVFTSGSSGKQKGVCLPEKALVASAEASAGNLGHCQHDRWLLNLPLAHIGGLSIWFRALWAGIPCVLSKPNQTSDEWARWALHTRVTLVSLVPTQLRALEDALCQLPNLRSILVGGAPLAPALEERAASLGLSVLPTYGLTEAASQVATRVPGCPAPLGSVGKILPHLEGRIRDDCLELRGESLFTGYWGDPPRLHESWFCTRDRARLDEAGNLFILGRADDVIVTGGENVNPSDVEATLLELGVEQACVFGVPDEHWGQTVACVLAPATLDLNALKQALVQRLPSFMRPRRVLVRESLPLNPTGKVDRSHITTQYAKLLVTW